MDKEILKTIIKEGQEDIISVELYERPFGFEENGRYVMVGLQAAGLDPLPLIVYGTIGNVLGSMFNYGIGRMGRIEWIERYLHVKKESLDKAQRFVGGRGAWMGFFAFLPILGSAITILLGLMKANIVISITSISIGKFIRYLLLVYGASFVL